MGLARYIICWALQGLVPEASLSHLGLTEPGSHYLPHFHHHLQNFESKELQVVLNSPSLKE